MAPNRADPIEEKDPMPVPHPQQASAPGTDRSFDTYQPRHAGWVLGMSVFAAIVMIMVGFFHVVEGLAALFDNEIYLAVPRYMFSFNVTVWGWIHLLVGVLLMAAGFAIRTGRLWVRSVGIAFAALSMIANFLFIPYYPVWPLLVIVLDFFVIWALCLFTGYGTQD